jgi:hypothetical protein
MKIIITHVEIIAADASATITRTGKISISAMYCKGINAAKSTDSNTTVDAITY